MQLIITPNANYHRPGADKITVLTPGGHKITLTRTDWSRLFARLQRELIEPREVAGEAPRQKEKEK